MMAKYLMAKWIEIKKNDVVWYKGEKGIVFQKGRRLFIKFQDGNICPVKQFAISNRLKITKTHLDNIPWHQYT